MSGGVRRMFAPAEGRRRQEQRRCRLNRGRRLELVVLAGPRFSLVPKLRSGTHGSKLRFESWPGRETEFVSPAFPNEVWERGTNKAAGTDLAIPAVLVNGSAPLMLCRVPPRGSPLLRGVESRP